MKSNLDILLQKYGQGKASKCPPVNHRHLHGNVCRLFMRFISMCSDMDDNEIKL